VIDRQQAHALREMAHHFRAFSRNGRWGTCGGCPRSGGDVFPEFCEYTDRYDHQLTALALVERWSIEMKTSLFGHNVVSAIVRREAETMAETELVAIKRHVERELAVREHPRNPADCPKCIALNYNANKLVPNKRCEVHTDADRDMYVDDAKDEQVSRRKRDAVDPKRRQAIEKLSSRAQEASAMGAARVAVDTKDLIAVVDDDPYEGSFREAADNEGARIAAEERVALEAADDD
jgi:hypothetical protein